VVAGRGNFHLIGPLYRERNEAKLPFIMNALQFPGQNEAKYLVEKKGTAEKFHEAKMLFRMSKL
jgi:hypothetical protein